METRKIAMACFIGGFICSAVAVAVNPIFWWMGLIAGFASGYLAYEFRETLRAIPRAWKSAQYGSSAAWGIAKDLFKECFMKPHPFWHPVAVCFALIFLLCYWFSPKLDLTLIGCFFVAFFLGFFLLWLIGVFIMAIGEGKGYKIDLFLERYRAKTEKTWQPITYRDSLYWTARGIFRCIVAVVLFFVWHMWKNIVIFSGRFAKAFLILIHSSKRLLCAIDGTIGGAIAYIYLASPSMTIQEKALLCVFGGVIGAVVGVANYEVVSKGLLRLPVNSS